MGNSDHVVCLQCCRATASECWGRAPRLHALEWQWGKLGWLVLPLSTSSPGIDLMLLSVPECDAVLEAGATLVCHWAATHHNAVLWRYLAC